jgi:hypothetical protein
MLMKMSTAVVVSIAMPLFISYFDCCLEIKMIFIQDNSAFRRIKYNVELYSLCKDPDIVRRELTFQKYNLSQPEGSRIKGRPKLRRLDSVLKDVKLFKVEAWWRKALDRNIWGRIIKQAKVHKGL